MENNPEKEKTKILEEGMISSRRNSSLYLIVVSIIFIFANIAAITPLTGIPIFFYNHKYLCKESNSLKQFNIRCSRNFVCSNNNKLNIDYILDRKNNVNLNSFITSFDIYCSPIKRTLLASSFFFGQLIGTIIYPYLISFFGIINSLSLGYFTIFLSYLIIAKYDTYFITIISYIISSLAFQICMIGFKQYIVEMSESSKRPIYLLFNLLSQIISGFFVVLISYLTLDYKYLLLISSVICILGVILVKLYVVESIRILFVQGKIEKLMENLEYISKINNSKQYFDEWKRNNKDIFFNNNSLNNENLDPLIDKNNDISNNSEKLKKYNSSDLNELNYLSIWKYPSQVKLIILFSFATFYGNYSLVLSQFGVGKQKKFFFSLLEGYFCDMIGYFLGILITELKNVTRKTCFLFLTFLLSLIFAIQWIFYSFHNQYSFIFLRIFINSLDANFNLYNFESFPTLARSTGVAINRIFGKFFNIFTPLLMINFMRIAFLCGLIFGIILFLLSLILGPKEAKDHKINEFPIEFEKDNCKENENEEDVGYLLCN